MKDPPFKVLEFDIETAPALGFFFDYRKEYNIIEVLRQGFILSVAWKWRGDDKIECVGLPDFPLYKRDKLDDHQLVQFIHKLFKQADVIVGHNGDNFDVKWCNSRFIFHRLDPPPPYKTRDTLKISRKVSHQLSHRLDALAQYYGVGRKLPHTGKTLWLSCYNGDLKAWKIMKQYNKHDVYLLDKVLDILDPWDKGAVNRNLYTRRSDTCPRCGSTHIIKQGYKYVKRGYKQRYQCLGCHGYLYSDIVEKLDKVTLSPA